MLDKQPDAAYVTLLDKGLAELRQVRCRNLSEMFTQLSTIARLPADAMSVDCCSHR